MRVKPNGRFIRGKTQEKPALFLTNANRVFPSPNVPGWQPIPKPISGFTQDLDVLWRQAHFFIKLTVHGLLSRLTRMHTALWKLPRVAPTHAPPPQQSVVC